MMKISAKADLIQNSMSQDKMILRNSSKGSKIRMKDKLVKGYERLFKTNKQDYLESIQPTLGRTSITYSQTHIKGGMSQRCDLKQAGTIASDKHRELSMKRLVASYSRMAIKKGDTETEGHSSLLLMRDSDQNSLEHGNTGGISNSLLTSGFKSLAYAQTKASLQEKIGKAYGTESMELYAKEETLEEKAPKVEQSRNMGMSSFGPPKDTTGKDKKAMIVFDSGRHGNSNQSVSVIVSNTSETADAKQEVLDQTLDDLSPINHDQHNKV